MILTDEMKRRIKEEYERLQKERVDIEGDYHDKTEPKPITIVSRKDRKVKGRYRIYELGR